MPIDRYPTRTALKVTGVTPRQLDYWVQLGLVRPALSSAAKRPNRRYSFRDLIIVKAIAELRDAGVSLQEVRAISRRLSGRKLDFANACLVCVGGRVYEYGDGEALQTISSRHPQLAFTVVVLSTLEAKTSTALIGEVPASA